MELLNKAQLKMVADRNANSGYSPDYAGASSRQSQHGSSSNDSRNIFGPSNEVVDIAKSHPEIRDCLNGIMGGMIGGSVGGPGSAVASAIGGGIGTCFN